jgi:hypothetical protein
MILYRQLLLLQLYPLLWELHHHDGGKQLQAMHLHLRPIHLLNLLETLN